MDMVVRGWWRRTRRLGAGTYEKARSGHGCQRLSETHAFRSIFINSGSFSPPPTGLDSWLDNLWKSPVYLGETTATIDSADVT